MVRSHDDGADGREEGRRVACETGPRKKDRKRRHKRNRNRSSAKATPPAPPPAPSKEHRATTSDDDGSAQVRAMVGEQVRHMLAVRNARKKETAELFKRLNGESDFSVEDTFGDCNDGSLENLQARKVALLVSKSIVSLSSFAGGKRIRVCSGFVMRRTDDTDANMVLTSATLVRSLNGDNNVISDVTVKVLLPDWRITDGHILLEYNVAVVKVATDLPLLEEGTTNNGVVLALGRAYEGGNLMCSRCQAVNKESTFGCLELLVSSCEISMAGSGGPLVNYNGQVLGMNFYENNQTSYLPMLIVSRILEQHQSFGKLISPWLGLRYTSLHMVSLATLERIYRKFLDVDQGLYVSKAKITKEKTETNYSPRNDIDEEEEKSESPTSSSSAGSTSCPAIGGIASTNLFNVATPVVEGSPADVAGLCVGDIIVKCGEKVLPTVQEFGSMLLDAAVAHVESFGGCDGDMTNEVVIKRRRDGCTLSKTIVMEMLKENNYNRWPAPMPSYKMRFINVTPRGIGGY